MIDSNHRFQDNVSGNRQSPVIPGFSYLDEKWFASPVSLEFGEDDYAELYLNINPTEHWIELREKDEEYRATMIKFLKN